MFFELSKLLNFLLFPVTWIILLLAGCMVLRRVKLARRLCLWGSVLVFLIFTNGVLFHDAESAMTRDYRYPRWDREKTYRTAIVMGGFARMDREKGVMQYLHDRADRLWEAVRLYRTGKVEKILITGDASSLIGKDGNSTAALFLRYMQEQGVPPEAFLLEQKARNSRENAVYAVSLLKSLGIRDTDCLLITSATHMKRSLTCFSALDWNPDWYPVGLPPVPEPLNHRSFYPSWEVAVKWQELLNEWIGNMIYHIAGYGK